MPQAEQRTLFKRFTDSLRGRSGVNVNPQTDQEVLVHIIGDQATASIKRDTAAYLKAFSELPWLRASVTKVANSTASNDWEILYVIRETDKNGDSRILEQEPTEEIPLQTFINNPNLNFSFQQIIWLTQAYLELVGEAFWWMVPIAGVVQAYPVSPGKVVRVPSPEEPFFTVSGPQGEFRVAMSDMIWFTQPDPADPYSRGVGLAQSLSHDLDTDDAASRYVLSYFNNNARPPLLIYGEGLNAERVRQLEDDWNLQHQGFWNAGKARFLSRKVEIKELSQKFEGTDIVNLRQHQRDVTASVIGVPPEILGILQASNRATIDAADLFFSRYTLKPRLDYLQETLNKQLIPRFDDTGTLVMLYVNPVQKDKDTILKAARFMPSALMIDEWRELMEYPPLDDGDGQCFVVPINVQVLSNLKSGKIDVPAAAPMGAPPKDAGQAAYGELKTPHGTLKGRKTKRIRDLERYVRKEVKKNREDDDFKSRAYYDE
ncbi:MAG: phage portal protein [Candidatus Korobacteraceae bacterium]